MRLGVQASDSRPPELVPNFKAFWASRFDPDSTSSRGQFYREDGETIETSMMYTQAAVPRTELDGFQVLEMPFQRGRTSMVVIRP